MAAGQVVSSLRDIAITRQGSLETTMHPLGIYLAITDSQRENGWGRTKARPAAFARVDAMPMTEPEPVSRIGRLAAMLRRRVLRTAGV
jgi:hypothetical protein